jgi:hypothetical protein
MSSVFSQMNVWFAPEGAFAKPAVLPPPTVHMPFRWLTPW